jgi:hypothetical protein
MLIYSLIAYYGQVRPIWPATMAWASSGDSLLHYHFHLVYLAGADPGGGCNLAANAGSASLGTLR